MAKDFRTTQIETTKIILSGGIGNSTLGGIVYSGSVATDREGGIPSTMLDNVGSDVELFISGTIDGRGNGGIVLVGGDLHISGNLTVDGSGGTDVDWVDRGNSLVTTSSVSIAGGLGDTFKASDADTKAFMFVSGARVELGTLNASSTGIYAGTPTNVFFGGDVVFSGSLHGRSPGGGGSNIFDVTSDDTIFRKVKQFVVADGLGNAPSSGPTFDSNVGFTVSGSIDSRGVPAPDGDSGISLFGGDLVVSGALHTEHSVHRKITIHSSNFNVNSGMHYMHISPSAHVTASLQTAAGAGEGRILTFVDSSGLAAPGQRIVIEPNGAETISGASSAIIETAYGSITIQSDGVNKYLIVGTN
jgi:hypothetical protein